MIIGRLTHFAVAMLAAASLVVAPVYAQAQDAHQQGGQAPAQTQSESTQPSSQPVAQLDTVVSATARTLNLSAGPNYSRGKPWFPNIIAPYTPREVPEPMVTNTPKLDQLMQGGKLMLSLDDAITIALEDNLDINVERFIPWIAQTQLLKAQAGGVPQSGSAQQVVLGNAPQTSFDPVISGQLNWIRSSVPVNNGFLSGLGSISNGGSTTSFGCSTPVIPCITSNNQNINFNYSQGFHTGTSLSVSFDNDRGTSTSGQDLFNPDWVSSLTLSVSQPLLNGFGKLPNIRFILEAKNSLKVANSQFAQQVITTVTQVSNDYWELVFARENVKVEEAAVGVDQKLYEDNKKQLQIGTMAPLDVLTAESQLATDQQNLIVAQTTMLQDETILLVAITKDALAGDLTGIEIVPTTPISTPDVVENIPLDQAVREAWQKRPEILQSGLNLQNAKIEERVTKSALKPTLNAFLEYGAQGLAGNRLKLNQTATSFAPDPTQPILNETGVPAEIGGLPLFLGTPTGFSSNPVVAVGGLGDSLDSMIHNRFPVYGGGLNLILPIRNRSAQADNARAQLDERQQEVQLRQTENTILLAVRNAMIALQQDRNQVAAADKARDLAQQTLDDEQKKYQLGTSTSYNVVLRARDLTGAQGTEVRARANLMEAVVNFNQAMGRTLEANHIIVADALRGKVKYNPLIPGTPDWDATPGNK